jgi:GH25 family lysozyme M1 (1,4-beta-N-acetylmuramidase)
VSARPYIIRNPAGVELVAFLDVSGWQFAYAGSGRLNPGATPPDYRKAAARGVAGVIARIGNGTSVDESFALGYAPAKAAGLAVGAYYYAQPNRLTGPAAAELAVRWLEPYELELPLMLDLEEYHGAELPDAALTRWVRDWLERVAELTGRRPLLYAGNAFANDTTLDGSFADYDTVQPRYPRGNTAPPSELELWAAWIPWDRPPVTNAVLGAWDAWQFSSSARWPDFGGPADAAVDRLDVNVVPVDVWRRWTPSAPSHEWSSPMTALHMLEPEVRIVDTRTGHGLGRPAAGVTFELELPADHDPRAAVVHVTTVGAVAPGYLELYGTVPGGTSKLNYTPADPSPQANTTLVAVGRNAAGRPVIRGRMTTSAELIVDLVGVIA